MEVPAADGAPATVNEKSGITRVIDEVLERRKKGEFVSDEGIIAEHPQLMPELADELRSLEGIRRAFLAAQKAGPIREPLKMLSADELDLPIDESSRFEFQEPTGIQISGYTIIDEVNCGGQAMVYKAIQDTTGRKVAIKVVFGIHSRARVRIDREADILVSLDHPNIVDILDRGRTADGSFFISMEFVEGYSLDEFLQAGCAAGPATLNDLVQLFISASRAVGYAHEKGVVHRDLKPSNIRIDLRGEPRILDFGLASLIEPPDQPGAGQDSITHTGQLVGSLPWCSPEQAAGRRDQISARSDVYALGLMLYQAIAGQPPYPNLGLIHDVVRNVLSTKPRPLAGRDFPRWGVLPEKLESIILRCLEKSPEARFASAGELAAALEEYLRQPGRQSQESVASKLRRPRWLAGIIAILLIGVGSTWLAVRPAPDKVNGRAIYENELGMRFVYCPPGTFQMGLRPGDEGYGWGDAIHPVKIEKGFYIGQLELTQGQYAKLMPDRLNSERYPGLDLPLGSARWIDAVEFCRRLSEKTKKHYRLPSEAEWEYACRAGTTGNFGGSPNVADLGWYLENSPPGIMPKGGTKMPNPWKIYDMHGSVWEWCQDDYISYDPDHTHVGMGTSKATGNSKIYRGGDIKSSWPLCRAGNRSAQNPNVHLPWQVGFRVVLDEDDVK